MTTSAAISLLILLLVVVAIAWVCFWLIDQMGIPHPMNWIARAIVALVALLFLLTRTGMV